MREIKFRAWDKERKKWNYFTLHNIHTYLVEFERHLLNGDEFYQYTGLKDKNSKEIYESDRVRDDKGTVSIVKWDDVMTGWQPSHRSLQPYIREYEVIGNIYENPVTLPLSSH